MTGFWGDIFAAGNERAGLTLLHEPRSNTTLVHRPGSRAIYGAGKSTMLQVSQHVRTGVTRVVELPDPIAPKGGLLVATAASLISAGTERYVVELARKSLLAKARERPDHVRRVLQKMRQEGLIATATQVRAKLEEPMPLGYSAAGIVLECGQGVQEFKPGDRVACVGPHAGVVSVGRHLAARIPDGVSFADAAYASVGAIALEGVRLAKATLGERVVVIGLGLIGQITVMLLRAQGCKVYGVDPDAKKVELARSLGADVARTNGVVDEIMAFADGQGVDAVIITASTESNGPIELAAEVARVRGRIVLVGVAGLAVPRPPFFLKELEFTVSGSLGPGRNDPAYEERGQDYPIGFARWTAGRNMQAVLDLIADGKVLPSKLTTHRMPIEDAQKAYDLVVERPKDVMGIVLEYSAVPEVRNRRIELGPRPAHGSLGVGLIGAGNFARLILLPLLAKQPGLAFRGLCTAKGMNAVVSGTEFGFSYATTDAGEIFSDKETHAVVIATRHDLHTDLVIRALRAGKHVFIEKPLCIGLDELKAIRSVMTDLGPNAPALCVGYNRRFTGAISAVREHFDGIGGPLSALFRFAPGSLPRDAWPHVDEVGGGRLIGEACHAIDVVTAVVGSPPARVFAESAAMPGTTTPSDDRAVITIRHRNGSVSTVIYDAGGDRGGPVERLEVFGGGRTAIVDGWDHAEFWRGGAVKRARFGKDKGHASELEAFFAACRTGRLTALSWEEIEGVSWASIQAVQSLRDGMPHLVDDELV